MQFTITAVQLVLSDHAWEMAWGPLNTGWTGVAVDRLIQVSQIRGIIKSVITQLVNLSNQIQ